MADKKSVRIQHEITRALANILQDVDSQVVLDNIEQVKEAHLVSFHVEGALASPVSFTFPFPDAVPLDQSLAALRELVTRNWQSSQLPPRVAQQATLYRNSAGAD